jgi:hypothetical protein
VQSRAGGSDRDPEHGAHLGQRQVQVVVEDYDRSMVDGQGSERSLQLVAVDYAGERIIGRPIGLDQAKTR